MKNLKTALTSLVMMAVTFSYANTDRNKKPSEDDSTLVKQEQVVTISILNTELKDYSLYVYSEDDVLLYHERLGNTISLGKRFDFSNAAKGTYRFVFKTNQGEQFVKTVTAGS